MLKIRRVFPQLVFILMGAFHFIFNYSLFMWNYLQGHTRWIYNNNSIGEANIEAVMMTILMPFFIYGAILYLREILKVDAKPPGLS